MMMMKKKYFIEKVNILKIERERGGKPKYFIEIFRFKFILYIMPILSLSSKKKNFFTRFI